MKGAFGNTVRENRSLLLNYRSLSINTTKPSSVTALRPDPRRKSSLWWLALGLGDKDQALAWLEKDVQTHNATMPGFMSVLPILSMRDDPRFKDLTNRIGLAELKTSLSPP